MTDVCVWFANVKSLSTQWPVLDTWPVYIMSYTPKSRDKLFFITWMVSRNSVPIIMRSTNHVVSLLFRNRPYRPDVSLNAEPFGRVALNFRLFNSNTTHHSTRHMNTLSRQLAKSFPYLAIRDNLWSVFCWFIGGNGRKISEVNCPGVLHHMIYGRGRFVMDGHRLNDAQIFDQTGSNNDWDGLVLDTTGLILGLHSANERRRYKVTPSLIGWAQTKNQSCTSDWPRWFTGQYLNELGAELTLICFYGILLNGDMLIVEFTFMVLDDSMIYSTERSVAHCQVSHRHRLNPLRPSDAYMRR